MILRNICNRPETESVCYLGSVTTKHRKRTEIYERAQLLSNDHFKGRIIVPIHFPNTKQSTTYGKDNPWITINEYGSGLMNRSCSLQFRY
ncbi:hypothetical protein OUZ56_009994 [Daphnia magna]|uniref:Uncharacterized protein n=1 Tax=Daphnia magna TaxID=35525 RepID=A0ABR0AHH9_9CRUS|nr:hypothetical protein OUZ56_009994 [Daphnia magna]